MLSQALSRITELEAYVQILRTENESLKQENKELKARLSLTSENSSKPPSSDGLKKAPAFPREQTGKKPGGQAKHPGYNLRMVENPDRVVTCKSSTCTCGHCLEGVESVYVAARQVFDMPKPIIEVTEYQQHLTRCPHCGTVNRGEFPAGVKAPAQYGPRTRAFAALCRNDHSLPYKKTCDLFFELTGQRLNASSIYNNDKLLFELLSPVEMVILRNLLWAALAHSDETGMRCEGELYWLHVFSDKLFTYLFLHSNRGRKAIDSQFCHLKEYGGWLVHDCLATYFKLDNVKHAVCGCHILRELQAEIDQKSPWATKFHAFLLRVKDTEFDTRLANRLLIEAEFDEIIQQGDREEPPPTATGKKGRKKRTKGRNLLERLRLRKDAVLAFAFNKEVPFTNNQAERDLRPSKSKMKVAGCFRDFTAGEIFARIYSFISTVRKHGQSVFDALLSIFEGRGYCFDGAAK